MDQRDDLLRKRKLNLRIRDDLYTQLSRRAAASGTTLSAIAVDGLVKHVASLDLQDAEQLVWSLVNTWSPAVGVSPSATFEISRDGTVQVRLDPDKSPPLEQLVEVRATPDAGQLVVELVGLVGDDFSGVHVRVGAVPREGGSLTVKLEDLAPSMREPG